MDVRTIYDYDNHNNIAWNMSEYHSPRLHFDQKAIIRQRSYAAQKKGVKDNYYYVTKRGFYMDYDLKQMKAVPSSGLLFLNQLFTVIASLGMELTISSRQKHSKKSETQRNIRISKGLR